MTQCFSESIAHLKNLRSFIARNPGVDPTDLINDIETQTGNCNWNLTEQTTELEAQKVVEVPQQPVVVNELPLPPAAPVTSVGLLSSTLALGLGALALGGGGTIAAIYVLNQSNPPVSARAN